MRILSSFLIALALVGCSVNPLKTAVTPSQKAFAVYGTFVAYEEQGAVIVQNATVPDSVKAAIRAADAKAKPAADSLLSAAREVIAVQSEIAAGTSTSDKLAIVNANLSQWIKDATPIVDNLVAAVGAKK